MLDLASIITGAVVVGILGAVTAASVIVVIPWFQNKVANDDINVIKTAQQSYYTDTSTFTTNINTLYTGKYLHKTTNPSCLLAASPVDPTSYRAYVKSNSGSIFEYTHSTGKIIKTTNTAPCAWVSK